MVTKKSFFLSLLILSINSVSFGYVPEWETPHVYQLIEATKNADLDTMNELIQNGVDVNASVGCDFPKAGYPVLRFAVDSFCLPAVRMLLDAGARVNNITISPFIMDDLGIRVRNLTLLAHAIRIMAPKEIIEALIGAGADINAIQPFSDVTPLMVAACVGNHEAVELLLDAGADKTIISSEFGSDLSAIDCARLNGFTYIIELLKA